MSEHSLPAPTAGILPTDPERRTWLLATGAAGGAAAVATAVPFVSSFAPSERAKAAGAAVEVELSDIAPGALKTVEWRGKPVWVMRRTPEMVAALSGHDAQLADPQSQRDDLPEALRNPGRSLKPELLVAVGICTHLGCSPTARFAPNDPSMGPNWPGGFLCPCHGSKFDLAGRVFANMPAPDNLPVPNYKYLSDTKLLIGDETKGA